MPWKNDRSLKKTVVCKRTQVCTEQEHTTVLYANGVSDKEDMEYSSSKTLNIILLLFVVGVFAVEAKRLPSFNVLRGSYPGRSRWGGLYSDERLVRDVGVTNATNMPNDTCSLRISTMLNLLKYHVITTLPAGLKPDQYFIKTFEDKKANFSVNIYFLLDIDALIAHFNRVYGIPLESKEPSAFIGRKGIMLMNVTDVAADTDACRALLWDGYGFHQAIGYLAHTNMSRVYFWQTPDEQCIIKSNPGSNDGGLCFPSESTVELETGQKMKMKDLEVGQQVKTIDAKGATIFTKVVTFLDKSEEHVGQYLTIFTQSGQRITMKPAHLVFKLQTDVTSKNLFKREAVYASTIKPGDYVYIQATGKRFGAQDRIVAVALGNSRGAFAPVTSEGTFLVDDVLVSCFADLADHDLAHSLMRPFRVLYSLVPNSFGAAGHHLHKYLKTIIRPIGLKVLGEDQFYKGLFQDQKNNITVED